MLEIFFALGIVGLTVLCTYFLFYQYGIYQQQKELITKAARALRILRDKNLEPLRSKFRFSQIKFKA